MQVNIIVRIKKEFKLDIKKRFEQSLMLILIIPLLSFISCAIMFSSAPTVDNLLNRNGFNWKEKSSAHFNYYFEQNSYASDYISAIIEGSEKNYERVLKLLNINSFDNRIHVFIVDSRKRMKDLAGYESNGKCFPDRNITLHIYSENIAIGSHELMHNISWNEWGKTDKWISEGLAVYSDDNWRGYELHSLVNYLNDKEKLIPIEKVIKNFHNYDQLITYPECGSFVKYLTEKYGIDLIKESWSEGYHFIGKKLNKNLLSIEQEWLQEIQNYDYENIDYAFGR